MQSTVEDVDFKLHRVVGRKRILHREFVLYCAANGLRLIVVAQAVKTGVEGHSVEKHKRIGGVGRHVRTKERSLHEDTVLGLQVVDHHIEIMWVIEAKRISRVSVVEAKVAVAVGVGKGNDALAAEGAVDIEEIGEARIGYLRLNRVFHRLLASHQGEKYDTNYDD